MSTQTERAATAAPRRQRRPGDPLGWSETPSEYPLAASAAAVLIGLVVAFVMSGGVALDSRSAVLISAGPVAAVLGAVAITRFEWFVLAVLVVRPSLDALSTGGLGAGAMLAAVFVTTAALWLMVQYRSDAWVPMSPATKGLVAFGGTVVLAVTTSELRVVSAVAALEILAGISMFLVLEQLLAGRRDRRRRLVIAVLLSGVIPVVVGFTQWLGGDVSVARSDLGRVQGTFNHPNPFATFLVMLILLTTALVTVHKGRQRVVLLAYLAALTTMLVVTYNRASWIAVVLGLAYIGARWNRKILGIMGAGLIIVLLAVPSVGSRISDLSEDKDLPAGVPDNSLEWRIQYWERLIPLANDSPFTGIGPQVVLNTQPERLEPHNVFVQAYVEMGVFGLVAIGAGVVGIGVTLSRRRTDSVRQLDQALAVAAIGVAIAIFTQSPSENMLNQTMAWWYFAATSTFGFSALNGRRPSISADSADSGPLTQEVPVTIVDDFVRRSDVRRASSRR